MNALLAIAILLQQSPPRESPRAAIIRAGDPAATACAREIMRPSFVAWCGEAGVRAALELHVGAQKASSAEDELLLGAPVYAVINYRVDPDEGTMFALSPDGECLPLNNWQLLYGGSATDAAGDTIAAWSRLRPRASRPLGNDELVGYTRTVLRLLVLPEGARWVVALGDIPVGRDRAHSIRRDTARELEARLRTLGYTVDASGAAYSELAWTPSGSLLALTGRTWPDGAMSLDLSVIAEQVGDWRRITLQ